MLVSKVVMMVAASQFDTINLLKDEVYIYFFLFTFCNLSFLNTWIEIPEIQR